MLLSVYHVTPVFYEIGAGNMFVDLELVGNKEGDTGALWGFRLLSLA